MNEYRLSEREKNQVAEMLNSKKTKPIIPGKIFPIIFVVALIMDFMCQGMGEFWEFLSFYLVFGAIFFTLVVYPISKFLFRVLDSNPDNRVAKEYKKGKYECKIADSIEFYHDDRRNRNMVRFQADDGLSDECVFFGQEAPEVVVLFFKKRLKRAFSFENLNVARQREMDLSFEMLPNIDLNDMMHQDIRAKYQANIEKLTYDEKRRGEQHGDTRIVFYQEMPPIQMYKNVRDNTEFVYRNRVPYEGTKVIKNLKGVGLQRRIGMAVQWLGLLITVLFVIYIFNYQSIDWDNDLKIALALIMFFMGPIVLPIVGGSIRIYGRKYLIDYLRVGNSLAGSPMEINRLSNGQLVILSYMIMDKSCSTYLSALNMDDTEWSDPIGTRIPFNREKIPTYIDYMYIIDSVKSCKRTKNGLLIESSGRYYGTRMAYAEYHRDSVTNATVLSVFTEAQITYRKEEILDIFMDMDQLEVELNSYSDYMVGRDAFSPLNKENYFTNNLFRSIVINKKTEYLIEHTTGSDKYG